VRYRVAHKSTDFYKVADVVSVSEARERVKLLESKTPMQL